MKKEYKKLVCIFSIIALLVGHTEISATENNSNFANLNTLKEGLLLSKNLKEVNDGFVYDINKDGRTDVLDYCILKRNILHEEPPAPEPPARNPEDYRLEEIAYDAEAFNQYANRLKRELFNGCGVDTPYGGTYGEVESRCILALLNNGRINGDVLARMLGNKSSETIASCTKFIYRVCYTQELCGTDLNFEKYTLDPSIGQYLNSIDDAYRNGRIEEVLYDMFMNGNIPNDYLYNPSVLPIINSYDKDSTQLYSEFVDEYCMNAYIDNLCNTVLGYSYSR